MKTFFEKINAWLLSLFLTAGGFFAFWVLKLGEEWGTIIELRAKVFVIILSFFLFILFWLWLVYQSKQEKIRLLQISSGALVIITLSLVSVTFIERHRERNKEHLQEITNIQEQLSKEIVGVGKITFNEGSALGVALRPRFAVSIENLSEKYCITDIEMSLTAYKDKVAFFKGSANLTGIIKSGILSGALESKCRLNPKGNTTLDFYVMDVDPSTFPPKPWTFSTTVKSVSGMPF